MCPFVRVAVCVCVCVCVVQTDTTIPLLSWFSWTKRTWKAEGRLWLAHADFWWPKQKHEKFAKINLYYVHKFIESLAQPEPAKDFARPLHTHTHIRHFHRYSYICILAGCVLAVFDMQISTVASSGCVNTENNSQSTVAGHGLNAQERTARGEGGGGAIEGRTGCRPGHGVTRSNPFNMLARLSARPRWRPLKSSHTLGWTKGSWVQRQRGGGGSARWSGRGRR